MTKAKRKARKKSDAPQRVSTWNDSAGHRRPTPERMRHGDWRTVDTEIAGHSAAYDAEAHPLDRLRAAGTITVDERDAGLQAAELFARVSLTSEGRSCLDITPVGTSDEDSPEDVAAYRAYCALWQRLGGTHVGIIRHVCVRAETPRPSQVPALKAALGKAVEFFAKRR